MGGWWKYSRYQNRHQTGGSLGWNLRKDFYLISLLLSDLGPQARPGGPVAGIASPGRARIMFDKQGNGPVSWRTVAPLGSVHAPAAVGVIEALALLFDWAVCRDRKELGESGKAKGLGGKLSRLATLSTNKRIGSKFHELVPRDSLIFKQRGTLIYPKTHACLILDLDMGEMGLHMTILLG